MKYVEKLALRDVDGGAVLAVKVVPGSSRDRIAGVLGDCLKITTVIAPEKGKANAAVARILADALGVSPRGVVLASGQTNPRKEFRVAGLRAEDIRRLLQDA